MLTRIEKSAFRPGEYVGYANGVWLIRKSTSSFGNWVAVKRDEPRTTAIYAFRLIDLDAKLEKFAQ